MCTWELASLFYWIPILRLKLVYGIGVPANSLRTELVQNPGQKEYIPLLETEKGESTLSIVVIGASGDLARRKIFPALFALFNEDRLPEVQFFIKPAVYFTTNFLFLFNILLFVCSHFLLLQNFTIFGYARSIMTDEELRNMISKTLAFRVDKRCYSSLYWPKVSPYISSNNLGFPIFADYSNVRDYRENCNEKMDAFLKRCFYQSGQYSSEEHFVGLNNKLKGEEVVRLTHDIKKLFLL